MNDSRISIIESLYSVDFGSRYIYYVHNMNSKNNNETSYRYLQLLEEISKDEPLSQRDLSKRLGIAVGLVNSYIKNFVTKGYLRVKAFPKNRYKYLLTPKGLTEKTRLTYQHLHYFTNLYTTVRKDFRKIFLEMDKEGVRKVLFCGVDEVAEIAYLSMQETPLELVGVVDNEGVGQVFFNHEVGPLNIINAIEKDKILVTSLKRSNALVSSLEKNGIDRGIISYLGLDVEDLLSE
ncbi:MAG: winged helix-turn-helix transcriptional regulator [Deltaproteobacteria bacterium]|nr:winged helix-turn-helix transcriptional regulator [Deltaproteobacteria bacterium]